MGVLSKCPIAYYYMKQGAHKQGEILFLQSVIQGRFTIA